MSRATASQFSIAGPRITWIACRSWPPIWLGGASPCSPPSETLLRWRRRRQRRRSRSCSVSGEDPVRSGLVASLARPGGNLTGISILSVELVTKRLELLRELVPAAAKVAVLVDPAAPVTETMLREVEMAARSMGLRAQILNASSSGEIDAAFATLARERPDALFVGSGFLLNSRRVQLVHLATLHKVPAIYSSRESVEAGGLMSYGPSLTDAHRQIGGYAGRILKGAKPADLPVVQHPSSSWSSTSRPPRCSASPFRRTLLARADEVIE